MRPLRLRLQNFTAFRQADQEAPIDIDFTDLDLVAIAGPTGAGKSSLLDAIVFALYGRIPRLANKGVSDMISLGRDTLRVVLDFRYGEKTYRIGRVARRGRASEAQIEELTDGLVRPLADGVRSVDKLVEEILGLGYEAFTQAVILPQGQFAKFLKSEPRERRQMLTDLLRLSVYERMRERSAKEAARLEGVTQTQEALLGQHGDATPEALQTCEAALAERRRENTASRSRMARHDGMLTELRSRNAMTCELRAQRQKAAQLQANEPSISTVRQALAAARRAALAVPTLDAAAAAEARARETTAALAALERGHTAARAKHAAARTALDGADGAAADLPALAERLRALDEASGLLEPLAAARKRCVEARTEAAARQQELASAQLRRSAATERATLLQADAGAARTRLDALAYDAGRHLRLASLRDDAAAAATAATLCAQAGAARSAALAAHEEAQAEAGKQEPAVRTAAERLARAEARCAETEAELRRLEREDAAAHLRSGLKKGDPCPVCERTVTRVPGTLLFDDVDAARAEHERAGAAQADAERQLADELRRSDRLDAARAHAEQAWRSAERDAEAARVALDGRRAELLAGAGDALTGSDAPERQLRELLQAMDALRTRHESAAAVVDRHERAAQQSRHEVEKAEQQTQLLETAVTSADVRKREAAEQVKSLQQRLALVTTAADPLAERELLAARREQIEAGRVRAASAERACAGALATAEAAAASAQSAAATARAAAQEARATADRAVAEAGFPTEKGVRGAYRPAAEQEALAADIEAHERGRHAAELRIAELIAALTGGEVGDQELAAAEAEALRIRTCLDASTREEIGLEHQLKTLTERLAAAAALQSALAEQRREYRRYRHLATDLRSENFQAYVLEETFRELVSGASERLQTLSGRYSLDFHEDKFHVLDHDNARERRPAETLSGGETFLASLALALELSQQIQRAAGAVHLDSLFIDEGFGTLDPETLETVADAVFKLPLAGRLVGIITHLPELTERLPARIQIDKHPGGSRLSVLRG